MVLTYSEYMQSNAWKALRKLAYQRSNNKCEYCGNDAVAVHHVKYPKQFKDDHIDNLIVVCKRCHELNHGLRECDKKNVYLAGTIHGIKWEIAKAIPFHHFYSSDSQGGRTFGTKEHNWCGLKGNFGSMKQEVDEYILDKTDNTDFLIAVLNKKISFGSIAEIAYFSAKGIPCYLIIISKANCISEENWTEKEEEEDEIITDAYWLVSNFTNVTTYYVENIEEAIEEVCGILGNFKELI